MQELIGSLVKQLGVNQTQAQGGASAIFQIAKERLGEGQFDQLLGGIPGLKDLISKTPAASSGGGGLLGGLASMASSFGGNDMAQGMKLLSAFTSLGMNKDMLMKFVPVVLQFLESKGGKDLVTQLRSALKI